MSKRLAWLQAQRDEAVAAVTSITDAAADADRDLSDTEQSTCLTRSAAVEKLDKEIEVEAGVVERQTQYEALAARVGPALQRTAPQLAPVGNVVTHVAEPPIYTSPGQYLVDVFKSRGAPAHGIEPSQAATERLQAYRATLLRAAPNQLVADNLGIVPTPILGPVINNINARRPAVDAATHHPMPAGGKTFERPRITQHTASAIQATEKTALTSQPLVIDALTITKATYGGYVNLSFQDEQWTDPAIMSILVADLAAAYAQNTDNVFADGLVAGVSQTTELTGQTAAAWLTGLYAAAAQVFAAGNAVPNTLWVAPSVWAVLGALVDDAGRPMFAAMNPQNAMGAIGPVSQTGSVAGFTLVVDANFATGTAVLGDAAGVEVYEQVGGTVSAVEPSVLGTAVAFYGHFAYSVVRPTAFVKIIDAV